MSSLEDGTDMSPSDGQAISEGLLGSDGVPELDPALEGLRPTSG